MKHSVKIVHIKKRIDRHFRLRVNPERRKHHRWVFVLIATAFIALLWLNQHKQTNDPNTLATINGEPFTIMQLQAYESRVPTMRNEAVSVTLDRAINERLLLQEATHNGIAVTEDEVNTLIQQVLAEQDATLADLQTVLRNRGINFDQLRENYRIQLTISKLLEQSVPADVREEQIGQFYLQNAAFQGKPLEEVRSQIVAILAGQQRQQALPGFLAALRNRSHVEIMK